MFAIYITNTSNSTFKIPFKGGVPYDRASKVGGILLAGRKTVIPNGVSEFIDMERLELFKSRGLISYTIKELPKLDITKKTVEIPKSDKKPRKNSVNKEDS